jgi:hypothetical protein
MSLFHCLKLFQCRCLDTSGGYLFHRPRRAGRIIEACSCLHNVARIGKVAIYKDFPAKDSFQSRCRRVRQPSNTIRGQPLSEMRKLRDEFVQTVFPLPKKPKKAVVNKRSKVGWEVRWDREPRSGDDLYRTEWSSGVTGQNGNLGGLTEDKSGGSYRRENGQMGHIYLCTRHASVPSWYLLAFSRPVHAVFAGQNQMV